MTRAAPNQFALRLAAGLTVLLSCAASAARAEDSFLDGGIESDGPIVDPSIKNIPKFAPGAESAGVAVASVHPAAHAGASPADCPPQSPCAVASPARDTPTPLYPVAKTERVAARKRS